MNAPREPLPLPATVPPPTDASPRPRWLVLLTSYEYWPFYVFFAPLVPYFAYLALRARSLTFFTAVNPGIPLGGLFGESKSAILDGVPPAYLPRTQLFLAGTPPAPIRDWMAGQGLTFPLVLKPDVGERGEGVRVVETADGLAGAVRALGDSAFLAQEWVPGPLEFGVFYYRLPDGSGSGVTSVVQKEFLRVRGDGYSTVRQLLASNERVRMAWGELTELLEKIGESVPAPGESVLVQPVGNHCRGTKFLDANALISPELDRVFDRIAAPMPGFYYGRFDLRVPSVADLLAGRNIRVLEVNGVTSEPGHVYDPAYSLLRAYADIARHLKIQYRISRQHRAAGVPVAPLRVVWACLRERFGG
jgi:hypothetical protein